MLFLDKVVWSDFMNDIEWCRKAKYDVQVELACYPITSSTPLLDGFESKEINGVLYACKNGMNILEQNKWATSPERPYVITGTVGERWPVKPSNMSAYDVEMDKIGVNPITVSTKDPRDQEFMVGMWIPEGTAAQVIPSWAYNEDGSIDNSQIMVANSLDSVVSHAGGDYLIAKHIEGEPEYFELPEEVRNTKEVAKKYSPRIINGSVMQTTYDHALTKEEIISKYEQVK